MRVYESVLNFAHILWNYITLFSTIFLSEYVMQHWKEDFMFGYQFLNGCNPVIIQKCTKLPDKFPVTHEMVSVSLERELTLEQEIEVGNVYAFFILFPRFHKNNKTLMKFFILIRTAVVSL